MSAGDRDVLRVILSCAARSARRTAHFDLEAPRALQTTEYWCHKDRRTCRPVSSAVGFLHRYALDTLERIDVFGGVRDGIARALAAAASRNDSAVTSTAAPVAARASISRTC